MKNILIVLCIGAAFFIPNAAWSQSRPTNKDSLITVLNQYPHEDTVKINLLIDIAYAHLKTDTEKARAYAEKSVMLAEQLQIPLYLAEAYLLMGSTYETQGANSEALLWFNKALPLFESKNDYKKMARIYGRFGSIANEQHDAQNAQMYYLKAIDYVKRTTDKKQHTQLVSNLASIYVTTGEYQKAVEAFGHSIALYEALNDQEGVARCLNNQSASYYYLSEYNKATECLQKALRINEKAGNRKAIVFNYIGLIGISASLQEHEKVIQLAKKGLEINESIKNKRAEGFFYISMGGAYTNLEDYPNAILNLEKSGQIFEETNNQLEFHRNLSQLGRVYVQQSQYSKAYQYIHKALVYYKEAGITEFISNMQLMLGSMLLQIPDSALTNIGIQPKDRLSVSMDYLSQSVEISRNMKLRDLEQQALKDMSKIYEMQGDFHQAYEYYKQYIAIKDSISGDEVKKQLTRKEIQYEFDKKEAELRYRQQLTAEQLEKEQLLTTQQNQQLTLNRQTLMLKERDLELSNKEKDLAHLAYLKEQAEKQEKTEQLTLAEEREKGKERDLSLKNLELLAQQKQNFFLILFAVFLLAGIASLLFFYYTLKKQKKLISQQNELNEHTISILSHDIKAPLMGVNLLLKKLNKEDPFVAQASQSLETQIHAVNGILNNLLRMKKLAIGAKGRPESANVHSVLLDVLQELSVAIQAKGIVIHNDIRPDTSLPVAAEKLHVILHNLLSNAVKYSFLNQPVRIYSEGSGICIQDFGVGLSPEQRSKLMREVTASSAGTHNERGHGMGLFLIGAILHGESLKILFDSPETGGTIVKVIR